MYSTAINGFNDVGVLNDEATDIDYPHAVEPAGGVYRVDRAAVDDPSADTTRGHTAFPAITATSTGATPA